MGNIVATEEYQRTFPQNVDTVASCCNIVWEQFFSEGNPNIPKGGGWLQSQNGPKSRVSGEAGCAVTSEDHKIKMHNSAGGMRNLQVNDGSFVRILVMKTALVGIDFSSEDC